MTKDQELEKAARGFAERMQTKRISHAEWQRIQNAFIAGSSFEKSRKTVGELDEDKPLDCNVIVDTGGNIFGPCTVPDGFQFPSGCRIVRVIEVTDSDSVSVPREKNVQILIDALENAKTDLRDLDTVCMADYKLVISGFSRAVLSIQIALSDFRKAQALSRGGE